MALILDIIAVVIVAITVYLGYRRGFLRSLIQFIGCVAAFIIALTFSKPIATFTFDSFLANGIQTKLSETVGSVSEIPTSFEQMETLLEDLPGPIVSVLENNVNLQESLENLSTSVADTTESFVQVLMDTIIRPVAVSLIQFIVFILLFIILLFVVRLIARLIKPITKLPLLHQADGALGAVLGLIKGAIFVLALVSVLQVVAATAQGGWITQATLEETVVVKWIAGMNPITKTMG